MHWCGRKTWSIRDKPPLPKSTMKAVICLICTLTAGGAAAAAGHYDVRQAMASDCRTGLRFGREAKARGQAGCLIAGADQVDLDGVGADPGRASYAGLAVSADLAATWKTAPKSALGIKDGFVPVRMDSIRVATAGTDGDRTATRVLTGMWVSVKGAEQRAEAVTITLRADGKDGWVIDNVTWP